MTIDNLNIFVANTLASVAPINENFETLRVAVNNNFTAIGGKASLNGSSSQRFAVANPAANNDAVNKQTLLTFAPVGMVIAIVVANVPEGYLLCDGSAVSRTTYSNLFTALGTLYGAGDESTTFNVPDFRGQFLRGYLSGTSEALGTAQAGGAPEIEGYAQGGYCTTSTPSTTGAFYSNNVNAGANIGGSNWQGKDLRFKASKSNELYGAAEEIRPINYAVNWCIKY